MLLCNTPEKGASISEEEESSSKNFYKSVIGPVSNWFTFPDSVEKPTSTDEEAVCWIRSRLDLLPKKLDENIVKESDELTPSFFSSLTTLLNLQDQKEIARLKRIEKYEQTLDVSQSAVSSLYAQGSSLAKKYAKLKYTPILSM